MAKEYLTSFCVVYDDILPPELAENFVEACRSTGADVIVEKTSTEVYAGLEDYIPTAIGLFLAKPFLEAFLKKAGEDAYSLFKAHVIALAQKMASIKSRVFTSGALKADPNYPFSRIISAYCHGPEQPTIKFLLLANQDDQYYTDALNSLFEMILSESIPQTTQRAMAGMLIMYFDPIEKKWAYRNFANQRQ